jgi:hypothetical protein
VGYHQTNRKTDTGKTLKRWPVFVDHFTKEAEELQVEVERLKSELEAYKRKERYGRAAGSKLLFTCGKKVYRWTAWIKPRQKRLVCLLILKLRKSSGRLTKKFHLQGEFRTS